MIAVIGVGRETRELLLVLDRDRVDEPVVVLAEGHLEPTALPPLDHLEVHMTSGVDLDDPATIPVDVSAVYRSPGVSPYRAALAAVVARGTPVTTPTGWWARTRDGHDTIAITGTKGKSTTAAMTAHLLTAAGRSVSLLGNIGRSALSADPSAATDDVVVELSSYQLADLQGRFAIGAVTTLLRDHVPWHTSLERYHADKLRLLALSERRFVSRQVAAQPATPDDVHGLPAPPTDALRDAVAAAGVVGEHFVDDAAMALALVDARLEWSVGVGDLVASLADFRPLPHRLTPVRMHAGVLWVDDSISTIPESAVAAARAYRPRGPVTLLVGGDDRGQDLAPLVTLLRDEGIVAVVLPVLADRLVAELGPVAPGRVHPVDDLAAAVSFAARTTRSGGSVVLSPAAPSFGSYPDYAARGDHFVSLVAALP